ncbi:DUF2391 family protein [Halobaculum gomorrense]|uniref:Putative integral membrane protein n=1 Tax=Halobaculum gomorrense TaxID=43928 RepID=A0A1M5K4A8_9EURY|nr:DUF2391 family protein [Halobaculum gomorrense]SHG47637.1 Putative integral membrane protein [Halobaculum gomorrense]
MTDADAPARPNGGESAPDETGPREPAEPADPLDPTVEDLIEDLETLEAAVDDTDERRKVRAAMRTARDLSTSRPTVFGRVVRGFDRGDIAEALLGSVLFGIPMLVEGGTTEVGTYLAAHPASLLVTAAVTVLLVVGIIYVADFQDVRVHRPILGVVPRRLVGVLGVAALTAVVGLTAWGRIDWGDPAVALGSIVVAAVPMAVGAALGDLLPG